MKITENQFRKCEIHGYLNVIKREEIQGWELVDKS